MKIVRIYAPGEFRIDEIEDPRPGPRDAVVRVAACGICGTDLRYVRQGGLIGPSGEPMPIGHELSGVVESVGSELNDLAVGTRVVLNPTGAGNMIGNGGTEGGFAPRVLVRNAVDGASLFAIPDSLSDDVAALTEPLGVGMNAVDRSDAHPGEKVVVIGAGPIGLAAVAVLADRGIEDVIAVDLSPKRLEIASALGARTTINASEHDVFEKLREIHGEQPVLGTAMAASDVYIEASGHGPMISKIVGQAKAGARLTVVALHMDDVPVSFLNVMMKQMTIRGAMEYPANYREMIELLCRRDLSPMISHRFPLARFSEAFAIAADPQASGKVIVQVD
jgi:threonine dehydrogenase-like Zn-dependent dehydrogenase